MFIGGPNQRKDYHIEEGEEVCVVGGGVNLVAECSWSDLLAECGLLYDCKYPRDRHFTLLHL